MSDSAGAAAAVGRLWNRNRPAHYGWLGSLLENSRALKQADFSWNALRSTFVDKEEVRARSLCLNPPPPRLSVPTGSPFFRLLPAGRDAPCDGEAQWR